MRTLARISRMLAATWLLVLATPLVAPARQIDYRSWDEGTLVTILQSILYDQAKLYVIGESSTPGIYQTAMLLSEDSEIEDAGTKNAILFECGMHAREWFAAESCYWLIDHLVRRRRTAEVRQLLSQADVWIIPQTNPAGRDRDDLAWGDPTEFAFVCDIGSRAGLPCTVDTDCPGPLGGPDGRCWTTGWRANADTASCELGIDLARNFSSGWDMASSVCRAQKVCRNAAGYSTTPCTSDSACAGGSCKNVRMHYRGPNPFSEPETLNLRRFVNNHMISMVAILHTNAQQIWNRWYDSNQASKFMTDELRAINAVGSGSYTPSPDMMVESVGGGFGQFSAWLTSASNHSGDLDHGTERNISTFYFELPIKDGDYRAPYRNSAADGSNSFHPSDADMEDLWDDAIRPMMMYLIRQARSPQCPIYESGARVVSQCDANDFGLVGAKIAEASDEPGLLDYDLATREETLPSGTHRVAFAVQNFGAPGGPTSTNATVTVRKDGSPEPATAVPITLGLGDRATYQVPQFFAADSEYEVRIELDPDDFARNDTKVFKFRVTQSSPLHRRIVASWSRLRVNEHREGVADDSLSYRAKLVLGAPPRAHETGVQVLVRGRAPLVPTQAPPPTLVAYSLPGGSPWWDDSKLDKNVWRYRDPDGKVGPVTKLDIKQKVDKKTGERKTRIVLVIKKSDLGALAGSRSYAVTVGLPGDDLILWSAARGKRKSLVLPEKLLPPMGETEEEPDSPSQQQRR